MSSLESSSAHVAWIVNLHELVQAASAQSLFSMLLSLRNQQQPDPRLLEIQQLLLASDVRSHGALSLSDVQQLCSPAQWDCLTASTTLHMQEHTQIALDDLMCIMGTSEVAATIDTKLQGCAKDKLCLPNLYSEGS